MEMLQARVNLILFLSHDCFVSVNHEFVLGGEACLWVFYASGCLALPERACSERVNNFQPVFSWNEETGSSLSLFSILLLAYFPLLVFCIPNAMNKSGPKDLEGGTAVATQKIEPLRLVLQL